MLLACCRVRVLGLGIYPTAGSSINIASSQPSGVEKDSTAVFARPSIETESPVFGSIQNEFTLLAVVILFILTEKEVLLPKYTMIHLPSL